VSPGLSEYEVDRRPLLESGRAEPKYCMIDDTRLGLVLMRRRLVSTRLRQITSTPPVDISKCQMSMSKVSLYSAFSNQTSNAKYTEITTGAMQMCLD